MDQSFTSLGVPAHVAERLETRGITTPTPIQAATIPDGLAGRDVCGRAQTGSGKTIAFGVPLLARTEAGADGRPRPASRRPVGLVLVPTRELALQVLKELGDLDPRRSREHMAIFGGVGYGPQRKALDRGVSIVVACPGRLEDLLEQGALRLDAVSIVVVDEADRMADMGFMPAVRRLLDATPNNRQTLLFSATLGKEVDALVQRYQRDAVRHDVTGGDHELPPDVEHVFKSVGREERPAATASLVAEHGRAIVFCRTRHGADRLARQLSAAGVSSAPLHGSRSQAQRERALHAFSVGKVQALVATDVAARGIHVTGVPCVVHFDMPASFTDYVHRSGRTGRAGLSGTVVSLVLPEQRKDAAEFQRSLEASHQGPHAPWSTERQQPRSNGRVNGSARPASRQADRPGFERIADRSTHRAGGDRPSSDRPASRQGDRPAARQGDRPASRRSDRPSYDRQGERPGRGHGFEQPRRSPARIGRSNGRATGTVTFFNESRGFGFIRSERGEDVFVHHSNVAVSGPKVLAVDQRVTFDLGQGKKGSEALAVRPA
jgi:superfamily II DNA/RNA helicase